MSRASPSRPVEPHEVTPCKGCVESMSAMSVVDRLREEEGQGKIYPLEISFVADQGADTKPRGQNQSELWQGQKRLCESGSQTSLSTDPSLSCPAQKGQRSDQAGQVEVSTQVTPVDCPLLSQDAFSSSTVKNYPEQSERETCPYQSSCIRQAKPK